MDLLSILPLFPTKPYTHLLPSLERAKLTTTDLITLDILELAKRAHLPPTDIRRLAAHIIEALHGDVGFERKLPENVQLDASVSFDGPVEIEPGSGTEVVDLEEWRVISTLDEGVDELLDGGLPTGYLTEVTGESGSGKTQFLLSLLLSVQLPSPKGLQKRAIYISTEAPLSTPRLTQMLNTNPHLSTLPPSQKPTLSNILSINAMDLESQDHILNYQVPVAVKRYNVGLIVIDSLTANYRAEHTSTTMAALSSRSADLARLGHLLRCLAVNEDIAVVVANQVSDRFGDTVDSAPPGPFALRALRESGAASPAQRTISGGSGPGGGGGDTIPSSSPAIQSSPFMDEDQTEGSGNSARNEILSLLHQQRFFTGWGDTRKSNADSVGMGMGYGVQKPTLKTPALGLVWSTQIACRIALKKEMVSDSDCSERVVFGGESQSSKGGDEGGKSCESGVESSQHNAGPEPGGERKTCRILKLVMAPWTGGSEEEGRIRDEVEFEIWKSGLRSRQRDRETDLA